MSLRAPSSRATCIARSRQTSVRAPAKSSKSAPSGFMIGSFPAAPLANTASISLVEVSPSTETRLKLLSTARFKALRSAFADRRVRRNDQESSVAMSGMNHPRTFGHAGDLHHPVAQFDASGGAFRPGVGGHDRFGDVETGLA